MGSGASFTDIAAAIESSNVEDLTAALAGLDATERNKLAAALSAGGSKNKKAALQFHWDQIPFTNAPIKPIWKKCSPEDTALLIAGFEDPNVTHVQLPHPLDPTTGFTVVLPKEVMAQKEPIPYNETSPDQFGTQTHNLKGWIRRIRCFRSSESDVLQFTWDEFVVERPEAPYEWSKYYPEQNAVLEEAFYSSPGSTFDLEVGRHGKYTITVPKEACPNTTELHKTRPSLEEQDARKFGVFGEQFSHTSQQRRFVIAVPK